MKSYLRTNAHQRSEALVDDGFFHPDPAHYATKHLQQGIQSDHFRVKKSMPKIGGFQSFNTEWRTIAGFEAMLCLRKGLRLFRWLDRQRSE